MKKSAYVLLFIFMAGTSFADEVPALGDLTEFSVSDYLSSLGETDADSIRLNTLGFYAYQEGDLYAAAKLWRCAVERDEQNAWAQYNLACAYALFAEEFNRDPATVILELEYGDPQVDRLFEYVNAVLHHLKQAVYYNRETWHRMQEDADLNLIRNMKAYQFTLLFPENDPSKLLEIIDTWYAPGYGAYPGGTVSFAYDTVTMESLVFGESGEPATVIETGHFTQQGHELTIYIHQPESRQITGQLVVGYDDYGFISYFYLTIEGLSYSSTPDFGA